MSPGKICLLLKQAWFSGLLARMPSTALIRQSGHSRRLESGRRQRAPRRRPVALLLGSLAGVAVLVTACAVVLDGSSGGAGWAEVAAVHAPSTGPTPLPAAKAGLSPAHFVGKSAAGQPRVAVNAVQPAYPPDAPQSGGGGQGFSPAASAPLPSAMQRSWSTIKLMFR